MKFQYSPPVIIKKLLSSFIWESAGNVLLTFDDGPTDKATKRILNKLDEHKIKSIFFCVGENLTQNPALVEQILSGGHTIANHTFNHKMITKIDKAELHQQIELTNEFMLKHFNYEIQYFRPPHGRFNLSLQKELNAFNLKCVMWSLLTYDYKNDLNIVKFAIEKYLHNNSIIVLHDSIKSEPIIEESIDFIVESINKQNYSFGAPSECLK